MSHCACENAIHEDFVCHNDVPANTTVHPELCNACLSSCTP